MCVQANRPKLRRWIDVFGEAYSRVVILLTLASLLLLPLMGVPFIGAGGERGAVYRAMGLLTTASPCALVLVRTECGSPRNLPVLGADATSDVCLFVSGASSVWPGAASSAGPV